MILHEVVELYREGVEDLRGGSDDGALMAVATGEVLTGDDSDAGDLSACTALEQDKFGMVIGEEAMVDSLHDEGPEAQRLVGSLVIEQQLYVLDLAAAPDMLEPPDELLGYREGCLPDGDLARHLSEAPLHYISDLQLVAEVRLQRAVREGAQDAVNCPTCRHPESHTRHTSAS